MTSVESTTDTLVPNIVRVCVSSRPVALGDTLNSSCDGLKVLTRTVSEKVRMICRGGTKLSMWNRKLTSSGLVVSGRYTVTFRGAARGMGSTAFSDVSVMVKDASESRVVVSLTASSVICLMRLRSTSARVITTVGPLELSL